MKPSRVLSSFIITILFLTDACIAQSDNPHKKINFDEDWKFQFGNASDPAKDFNYRIATIFSKSGKTDNTAIGLRFDDKTWRTLDLPHDWVVELPFVNSPNFDVMSHGYKPIGGLFPETSVGWYRKHFTIPASDSGQRFSIQFDGIFRDAMIWLNGFFLGNNKSGYVGTSYDITDYINFDRENVLVVRVDASQYEGWFYEGAGIYRHVWLNEYNNLHIEHDGVFIYSNSNGTNATINVESNIENKNLQSSNCMVYAFISDRNGKQLAKSQEQSLSLNVGENKTVKYQINLKSPKLWDLDDPYLYRVTVVLKSQGKIIDQLTSRFGVRNIRISANGFFLNGKHIKLQGTCNHQDHAGVGSALPDYLQYYRVSLLKKLGCNAIRTSHNAPTPELLEACDSLGMLVLDENRLLNSSPEYISQVERLLKRDRNHTCVFMWSIGNEEGWIQTNSTGKRIAQSLIQKQKELDPSRTATYAADVGNYFKGVNEVIPVRGFNYRQFGVSDYHRDHPTQPIVGTEMGSTVSTRGIYKKDTINGYVPDQDITAPPWASRAEVWWPLAAENDYWLGGFVWTGFDYRGEPTPYQWPNINSHFGIMDMCGFPKNIYYYYQSWWSNKDVLHISPHWSLPAGQAVWKGKEGQPIDVWVNSNADNVELFLNGKSLGKKDMPRNKHLQWSVNYEPGILEAIGIRNGKKITAKIETTGEPNEVVITPYKTTMLADGKDATVINVSVMDKQGREVPDANNLIKFSVSGDAKIIGVGNGDPASHEPDKCMDGNWQRKLFNGKCQLILQSGKNPGLIKVEARSDKLYPGSTDIYTVPVSVPKIKSEKKVSIILKKKNIEKMLGADISFLPELENRGVKFYDKGEQKDAIQILKDHGFNYIRLRIFNDPAADSGYSPKKGFCDLEHTKQMAKRIKTAGMKFLLDFHYSDYWADPGKQFKPSAWKSLNFEELKKAVHDYTKFVIQALKDQGTPPAMVQIGNEINHGMIWPDGHISHLDNLAELIKAGIAGVIEIDPSIIIMLHIALGGQHDESVFFLDNMINRGVEFDVIGESYYPKWHGTLDDLKNNLTDLSKKYKQDLIVVEYTQLKREVNDIAFNLPDDKGKGTCIWEPLNTWESIFTRDGKSNELILIYDEISKKYKIKSEK
jgi:beta-galactosidase